MPTVRMQIDAGPVRASETDRACAALADDLRQVRHVVVDTAPGTVGAGTKSPLTDSLDTLLVTGTFSVAVVKSVRDVVLAFLARGQARSVTVEKGDARLVVTAATDDQLAAVVARLDAILGTDRTEA
jgi:hypothetical protein